MTTMEDLNKTQLVLLTLLISFVTSIATGIITVSLLEEAPSNVTQTINRVVERTVEKVVPASSATVSAEELARLKASEEALQKIDASTKALAPISIVNKDDTLTYYAMGVIVSQEGLIVTDPSGIKAENTYVVSVDDKTNLPLELIKTGESEKVAVFKIKVPSLPENSSTTATP